MEYCTGSDCCNRPDVRLPFGGAVFRTGRGVLCTAGPRARATRRLAHLHVSLRVVLLTRAGLPPVEQANDQKEQVVAETRELHFITLQTTFAESLEKLGAPVPEPLAPEPEPEQEP